MPVNYGLDRSIPSQIDQHVDRVERLKELANEDTQAAGSVRQSLKYLKEQDEDKFQQLIQNPVVAEIYGERNQQENRPSQGNSASRSTQGRQPRAEHDQQESTGAQRNPPSTPESPKTHLVLTVGTNALPVWIAWYHLKDKLVGPVSVQFVYTSETEPIKKLLEHYFKEAKACLKPCILTSERRPIREDICKKIFDAFPSNCEHLHVHNTAGTQAMGGAMVDAMRKVEDKLKEADRAVKTVDVSYLDPGRSQAPNIVSWAHDPLIKDTRENIEAKMNCAACQAAGCTQIKDFECNACLRKVADLNNFEVAYFTSNHPPKICRHPQKQKPSENKLCAGETVLESRYEDADNFETFRASWNKIFRKYDRNKKRHVFRYPNTDRCLDFCLFPQILCLFPQILCRLQKEYPNCGLCLTDENLSYTFNDQDDQKTDLKEIDSFFNGTWLEYAAYAAFKKELKKIKRSNYEIFHNVYVRPKGSTRNDKHFELDVVAVLGYQVVVVSCSVTDEHSRIKLKAMEAYHRAKQLGGDEARAVVLCVATDHDVDNIQKELKDETGTKDPLQVWGKCNMTDLCQKFKELLRDLHWK